MAVKANMLAALSALGLAALARPGSAAPLLFVYRGAGCTGVAALPQFEAMLGRKVDGVVDFNDYGQAPDQAVSNLDWQLGCWRGHTPRLAISIGLAFKGLSTTEIAQGQGDAMFKRMGASLVAHGFAAAEVRLGWESNGGWYGWGRKGGVYAAAFDRAAAILKATPGSHFTVWFNPTGGLEMDKELPTAEDGMALDEYANTWNSGGATTEPGLWNGDLNGWWGFKTLGSWPDASLPTAVPELGVGSRGDGHGACRDTSATACDDPVFLAAALAQATRIKARFVGYWDYDAGDYNSQVSSGERPQEAAVLIRSFGGANTRSILGRHAQPFTPAPAPTITCTDPAGKTACHTTTIQVAPGRWDVVAWVGMAHPAATLSWSGTTRSADLYRPAGGVEVARRLGAASSVTLALKAGDQVIVDVQQ